MPSSWPQPAVLANLLSSSTGGSEGKSTNSPSSYGHRVLALYKFVTPKLLKENLPVLKKELESACRQHFARGTLLIAEEGINGTICYPFQQSSREDSDDVTCSQTDENGDELLSFLQSKFNGSLRIRISVADRPVFARLKIKIKSEIVTMHWEGDNKCSRSKGTTEVRNIENDNDNEKTTKNDDKCDSFGSSSPTCGPCCPTERVGEYVKPSDWNKLLEDPDTLVIDTRNEYEIDVGTFRNAVNPHTQSFVEFPDWIKRNLVDGGKDVKDASSNTKWKTKPKKVAMFCKSVCARYKLIFHRRANKFCGLWFNFYHYADHRIFLLF